MLAPMAATKAAMAAVNPEEVEGEAISPPILRGDPSEVRTRVTGVRGQLPCGVRACSLRACFGSTDGALKHRVPEAAAFKGAWRGNSSSAFKHQRLHGCPAGNCQ